MNALILMLSIQQQLQGSKVIMKNSKVARISIPIPTQSKSGINFDGKSIMISEGGDFLDIDNRDREKDINFDEHMHINKWLQCRSKVGKKYIHQSVSDSIVSSNCYLIHIDSFQDITYRKKNLLKSQKQKQKEKMYTQKSYYKQDDEESKVYLRIVANLYNEQDLQYCSRTVQFNVIELQHKSGSTYKASDTNLSIFFHCKQLPENKFKVRLELCVMQSRMIDTYEVVEVQEYLGCCSIDPFKGLKYQQKEHVHSQKTGGNLQASVHFTVLISDSFKLLQKLIPPHCLCSSEENIAGVAGRKLPSNMLNMYSPVQYTELHSMRLDIFAVDIPDAYLNLKLKQIEELSKRFENGLNPNISIKQIKLKVMFHNGWTVFCQTQTKLVSKMDIQKKRSNKTITELVKIKNYNAQNVCTLPFIFLDEEAIIVLQVLIRVEMKKVSTQQITSIQMPLCYAYYAIDKISADDKQAKPLMLGDGLQQFGFNNRMDSLGNIQFYVYIDHANKLQLSKHLITVNPNTNRSQTEADRILLQKQRLIKQNKKLRNQNRIKKIELTQQIPLLDTTSFKQNLYNNQIQKLRQERRQKEQLLQYLKRKVSQMLPSASESNVSEDIVQDNVAYKKNFMDPNSAKNFHNSIFYQVALNKNDNFQKSGLYYNFDAYRVHAIPIMLSQHTSSIFQSGQVPLQIIKTQLLEKNYSYAFFINWINLLPVNQNLKLPRRFRFEINFFNKAHLKSCICSINQMTGQIQVQVVTKTNQKQQNIQKQNEEKQQRQGKNRQRMKTNQEKKASQQLRAQIQKIFYFQIGPDSRASNNDNIFVELISYLYHNDLQIKIINAISNIQFGECFFSLKDLIRLRRNECSVMRNIWVSKNGQIKAKLKVQMKSVRKQAQQQIKHMPAPINKIQTLSMEPQARQLQRIAHFKKQNQRNDSESLKKVQKMLNEQLTKEEIFVNVSRMQGQYFKLNIINRKNYAESYRVIINDPDRHYFANEELVIVNEPLLKTISNTRWWRYLCELGVLQNKSFISVDEQNCFELNPGQSGTLLLYYYSDRKYQGDFQKHHELGLLEGQQSIFDHKQLFRVYNHSRSIDLTLTNTSNNSLHSIYKINIVSEPDTITTTYKLVRKSNSKLVIEVPFRSSQNYVLYIDDPTIISNFNENQGYVSLNCYLGNEGHCKIVNVSILSAFPQNKLLMNYHFQLWGARQFSIEGQLWQSQQMLIDLHSSICLSRGLQYVLALSEDQNIIQVREKNPLKINQKQAKTMIRVQVTPSCLGTNHYELNIVSPVDNQIIYRYSLKLVTQEPQIAQRITLRIKIMDKILEEPFGFKNQLPRKLKFKIVTTYPHILWSVQDAIQVDARAQKKFKIKINAQEVSQTENVILSLIGDKKNYHYLFVLQLDTML